ncbi:MAG: 3-isopropylmalate dehydratase small subunit, partial [Fibrobacterota bacterium]
AVYDQEGLEATVDLPEQTLIVHTDAGDHRYSFAYDPGDKNKLIRGLDDIEETLQYTDAITAFEKDHRTWIS